MSKISTAVSAILAAAAIGAAGAANATALVGAADHFIPTSGSTALDNAIKEYLLLSGGICTAPVNVYVDSTSGSLTSGVHNTLVVCNATAAVSGTTIGAGDVIGIGKESNGGSLEGTLNVARGQTLAFIDGLASGGVTCTGTTVSVTAGTNYAHQQAYSLHQGCAQSGTYAPQIGWADEIPATWSLLGDRQVKGSDIAALNTTPLVQNVFGIAVSLNAYRALQKMQGLTVGDDTLANMPSLSSAVITGLYAGNLDWSLVTDSSGNNVTTFTPSTTHAPNGTNAFICRRGDSSGTNASVDLQFMGDRCSSVGLKQTQAGGTPNGTCAGLPSGLNSYDFGCAWNTTNNLGDTVFFGSGGSDVAACLDRHSNNNDFAIGNLTTNTAFNAPNGPGGSTDTNTSTNVHFRFVAIDSRKPTLTNVANGLYSFVEDDVLNVSKTAGNATSGAYGHNVPGLATYITSKTTGFASATIVADFEGKQAQALASGGGAADTNWNYGVLFDANSPNAPLQGANTYPLSTTEVASYPVSASSQLLAGGVLNNCQPPATVVQTVNQ